ncbi:MAG TPA: hypothetical protein VGS98_01545 [Thermoanaerobaculia bacterium]|jgi:hypothetical protein|nr:hypothetical protein [Thermoanaerobaculia bacterium]
MKRAIRVTMIATAIAAVVGFLTPSAAQAQVRFEGRFRLPHGDIAVGVGDPGYYGSPYPVGSYVPYGYRVIRRPRYGYGFYSPSFACRSHRVYHSHWVPVRRYRTRWVVVAQPVLVERYARRPYFDGGYRDGYDGYRDGYRDQGYQGDPYYDFNREYWDRGYHPYDNPNYGPRHVHTDSCRH